MTDTRSTKRRMALQVLLVACMYLFVAIGHIFYLPCLTKDATANTSSGNSIFKRKTDQVSSAAGYINYLQRAYKSITDDKRSVADFMKTLTVGFVFMLFAMQLWKLRPRWLVNARRPDAGLQPVYLTIRSLRI